MIEKEDNRVRTNPATSAGRATVVGGSWVLRRLRHDGEDGLCVRDQTFDGI